MEGSSRNRANACIRTPQVPQVSGSVTLSNFHKNIDPTHVSNEKHFLFIVGECEISEIARTYTRLCMFWGQAGRDGRDRASSRRYTQSRYQRESGEGKKSVHPHACVRARAAGASPPHSSAEVKVIASNNANANTRVAAAPAMMSVRGTNETAGYRPTATAAAHPQEYAF